MLLLLVSFPCPPWSAAWLIVFFRHSQLPVPLASLKLWVDMSSPCLFELAFVHLFWGNPSLRPYLCATGRRWQSRNKKLSSGEAVVCSCSSMPWASAGLSWWGLHLPLLPCAVLLHPQDGHHSSVANTEIFVHSFWFCFCRSGLLKARQALVTSDWIRQCNMIILIHLENCQIHDEMNCDVALSSENFPLAFKDCLL